jgi:ElaB/YqjD/DUF883 family membrane-anchored ribosome-binding protein
MDPETHNGTPVAAPSSPLSDGPAAAPVGEKAASAPLQAAFRERFETLLPALQKQFPEVARHTLEATRGSFDHAVEVISRQTGVTSAGVRRQLGDLLHTTGDQAHQVVDALKPLEEQLEHLLDELNSTLRPKIEKPVRERPLLALGVAAGVGLIVGLLLNSGRRSA